MADGQRHAGSGIRRSEERRVGKACRWWGAVCGLGVAVSGFGVTLLVSGQVLGGVAVIGGGVAIIGPSALVFRVRRLVDAATKPPQTQEDRESAEPNNG